MEFLLHGFLRKSSLYAFPSVIRTSSIEEAEVLTTDEAQVTHVAAEQITRVAIHLRIFPNCFGLSAASRVTRNGSSE